MQNFAELVHEDPAVQLTCAGQHIGHAVDCQGHYSMLWYYMDLLLVFVRVTVFVGSHICLKWFGLKCGWNVKSLFIISYLLLSLVSIYCIIYVGYS
jgi:hypothetical protein